MGNPAFVAFETGFQNDLQVQFRERCQHGGGFTIGEDAQVGLLTGDRYIPLRTLVQSAGGLAAGLEGGYPGISFAAHTVGQTRALQGAIPTIKIKRMQLKRRFFADGQ